MISFSCDYLEGCHPAILEALAAANMEQAAGYGADRFTKSAKEKIRRTCHAPDADIFFVSGGTQTNQLIIDAMLAPYEGVLAADTGHISLHEAGAIEYARHKVLTLPAKDGKIAPADARRYVEVFYRDDNREHMVFPGMLYISQPTEYGTLYTAKELSAFSNLCKEYGMRFFIDGARLGYGLAAAENDASLDLIAESVDVFYIGGTKMGALLGEAIIFPKKVSVPSRFMTRMKQHGALLAKGRLLGIQFDTLFTDDLYLRLGQHAVSMAERLKSIFLDAGYSLYINSPTNQQFILLDNKTMAALRKHVEFAFWETADDAHTVVRFATSWATTETSLAELKRALDSVQP